MKEVVRGMKRLNRECCREILSREFWEILRGRKSMGLDLSVATYYLFDLEQDA